jgi:sugar (pentulose or hexulose) kinase
VPEAVFLPTQAQCDEEWVPRAVRSRAFLHYVRENPDTAAVVDFIVGHAGNDVWVEEIAQALGMSVDTTSGHLSNACHQAAKALGLTHKQGTLPWAVRIEDGLVVHHCPEYVATALR